MNQVPVKVVNLFVKLVQILLLAPLVSQAIMKKMDHVYLVKIIVKLVKMKQNAYHVMIIDIFTKTYATMYVQISSIMVLKNKLLITKKLILKLV